MAWIKLSPIILLKEERVNGGERFFSTFYRFINCYIYYKLINDCDSKYSMLEFRTALAEQIIINYASQKAKLKYQYQ